MAWSDRVRGIVPLVTDHVQVGVANSAKLNAQLHLRLARVGPARRNGVTEDGRRTISLRSVVLAAATALIVAAAAVAALGVDGLGRHQPPPQESWQLFCRGAPSDAKGAEVARFIVRSISRAVPAVVLAENRHGRCSCCRINQNRMANKKRRRRRRRKTQSR